MVEIIPILYYIAKGEGRRRPTRQRSSSLLTLLPLPIQQQGWCLHCCPFAVICTHRREASKLSRYDFDVLSRADFGARQNKIWKPVLLPTFDLGALTLHYFPNLIIFILKKLEPVSQGRMIMSSLLLSPSFMLFFNL